jgi:hypothetical protein
MNRPFLPSSLRLWSPAVAAVLATTAVALVALLPVSAGAQATLSHTEDAAPIPQGMIQMRFMNAWTRYDERFAANGARRSLGDELSSSAFGVAQLPRLAPVESGLRSLAANPALSLSLGRIDVRSDARIVTTPIALEYGITRRLSIGVLVPIVQTRRSIQLRANADTGNGANVGYVPGTSRIAAAAANLGVFQAFQRAADSLGSLISRCTPGSTAAGCAAVTANLADARAAQAAALSFASSVRTALGTDSTTTIVAPLTGSALAASIEQRRLAINTSIQRYLGAGAGTTTKVFTAPNALSYIDVNGRGSDAGLLRNALGGGLDSLHTVDRLGFGDIAVGARFVLLDHFQRDSLPATGPQLRMTIGGNVRFATSLADSARNVADIQTGEGAGAEVNSAVDLISGRLGITGAARYVKSFARSSTGVLTGDPTAAYPFSPFGPVTRTAGDVVALDLTPRLFLSEWLALDGHYGLERRSASTIARALLPPASGVDVQSVVSGDATIDGATAQRIGLGARFSTVDAYLRGRARFPIEVSLTHLETITGGVGEPKLFRDQVQLRLYYRLRGR